MVFLFGFAVPLDYRLHAGGSEIIELVSAGEYDNSNFSIAKDPQLLGLLQQTVPPLRKRHLPARRVIDPPYRDLPSPHPIYIYIVFLEREEEEGQKWRKIEESQVRMEKLPRNRESK